jgi:hypothetical protein
LAGAALAVILHGAFGAGEIEVDEIPRVDADGIGNFYPRIAAVDRIAKTSRREIIFRHTGDGPFFVGLAGHALLQL